MLSCEEYLCCSECNLKIEPKDACGTCTRFCTMVRLSKCPTSTTARIKIERDGGGYEIVSVFNNTIATIVGYADCESSCIAQLPCCPVEFPRQLFVLKIERAGVSRFGFSPLAKLFEKCDGFRAKYTRCLNEDGDKMIAGHERGIFLLLSLLCFIGHSTSLSHCQCDMRWGECVWACSVPY